MREKGNRKERKGMNEIVRKENVRKKNGRRGKICYGKLNKKGKKDGKRRKEVEVRNGREEKSEGYEKKCREETEKKNKEIKG